MSYLVKNSNRNMMYNGNIMYNISIKPPLLSFFSFIGNLRMSLKKNIQTKETLDHIKEKFVRK